MQKEFKVIGKVTYPQTINSHTTYTVMDTEGSNMMLSLDSPSDSEFDYGDAVILTVTKKEAAKVDTSAASTTVNPVSSTVTDAAKNDTSDTTADTAKSDTSVTTTIITTADAATTNAMAELVSSGAATTTDIVTTAVETEAK